jgi:hypothetical protein
MNIISENLYCEALSKSVRKNIVMFKSYDSTKRCDTLLLGFFAQVWKDHQEEKYTKKD